MKKNLTDKKSFIIAALILLGGIALTVTSFCVYYIVKPNTAVVVVICAIDFIYNFFSTCMFFKYGWENTSKWLLKSIALSVGYTAAFIVVGVLFVFFNALSSDTMLVADAMKKFITPVVLYSFFTGPSLFIVCALLGYGG